MSRAQDRKRVVGEGRNPASRYLRKLSKELERMPPEQAYQAFVWVRDWAIKGEESLRALCQARREKEFEQP